MSTKPLKQVILAAYFPGVNNTTVWHDPRSRSQIEFDSFVHLAQTAERGKLDFFFLAEGLRLREQGGKIHDLDTVGRPDSLTVLTALAAVTDHIGLAARSTPRSTSPTSSPASWPRSTTCPADGRPGTWSRRPTRSPARTSAGAASSTTRTATSGPASSCGRHASCGTRGPTTSSSSTPTTGSSSAPARRASSTTAGRSSTSAATSTCRAARSVIRSSCRPATATAAASWPPRRPTRSSAGTTCSRPAQAFYADVKGRLARYGRDRDDLKILPGVSFVLGDTPDDAAEQARIVLRQQFSPQTAILLLEQVWNRDLSAYDPEGPLPDIDPDVVDDVDHPGPGPHARRSADDRRPVAGARRGEEPQHPRPRHRDVGPRSTFVGTPSTGRRADERLRPGRRRPTASSSPRTSPRTGLDDFVDPVVPLLQERGVFRTEYETTTLRGPPRPDPRPPDGSASRARPLGRS